MKTTYKILFSIECKHDYYNNVSELSDIDIFPAGETVNKLKGYRILYKKSASGIIALIETDGNKPFISIDESEVFRFYMTIKNPLFFNITALRFFDSEDKVYYFSNKSGNEAGGNFYISAPIGSYQSSKSYEVGSLVETASGIFEAIQSTSDGFIPGTGDTNFWRKLDPSRFQVYDPLSHAEIPVGTIFSNSTKTKLFESIRTIPSAGSPPFTNLNFWLEKQKLQYVTDADLKLKSDVFDEEESKRIQNEIKNRLLGVIDIFFSGVDPGLKVINDAGEIREIPYELRFKNRISYWQYVSEYNGINKIEDSQSTFHFSATSSPFLSDTPVPLLAKAIQNFQLTASLSGITFTKTNIRCPASDIIPDNINKSFLSIIHLNY